jgi:hypothetical protein
MRVNFFSRNLTSGRPLLTFLVSLIFVFLLSHYITENYGLPQWMIIQIKSDKDIQLDVYYDIGKGYKEKYKTGRRIAGSVDFQTVRLSLPLRCLKSFRIDPLSEPGSVNIKSVELSSWFERNHAWTAKDLLRDFRPKRDIDSFQVVDGTLRIESTGDDPFFVIKTDVPQVNKVGTIELIFAAASLFLILFFINIAMKTVIRYASNIIQRTSSLVSKFNIREKYLIAIIMSFVFILNYPKLHLYFLSDDFAFIYFYQHLSQVFTATAIYHLNPVPQFFVFYLGNRLAGFNPVYYHILTLLLHLINVFLVFKLAGLLFRNKLTSAVASLLFAVYFMNYEVVYWMTGIFYILLTVFYISTLLLLIRYLNEKKKIYYALFVSAFALALLTMEQGVTLLGACIVTEILLPENLNRLQSSDLKQKALLLSRSAAHYIVPVLIIISFYIFKLILNQRFTVEAPTFGFIVKTITGMIWHLFIPYPYWVSNGLLYSSSVWNYRSYFFLIIFAAIGYGFIMRYRQQNVAPTDKRCLFASDEITYGALFGWILVYVIPLSMATTIQARYFYLPSVFSSIMLGNILAKNLSYMVIAKSSIRRLFSLLALILIATSIPVSIKFLRDEYGYWETASEITKKVLKDTGLYLSGEDGVRNIYYVNLPDGIYSRHDFGWPDAYVFRNGIDMAVRLTYPTREIGAIIAYRTNNPSGIVTCPGHLLATGVQIREFAADARNIVLVYDAKMRTVRKLDNTL